MAEDADDYLAVIQFWLSLKKVATEILWEKGRKYV